METKIRVGAVSYLNTKPLIFGFGRGMMKESVELLIDYPSRIASMLLENKIDVGLVPVAIIAGMEEYHIISDYCIGCDGEVASVCLFSAVPLEKIEKILLDYQSRSSVALLKVLIKHYWKINVIFEETSGDYQSKIHDTTAGLVIGDRALHQRRISPYIYDLGLEWKKFTGLPFVFAAWVSNKKLTNGFIRSFNDANSFGLDNIDEVIVENHYEFFDLRRYYSACINFEFNDIKRKALQSFLDKMASDQLYF